MNPYSLYILEVDYPKELLRSYVKKNGEATALVTTKIGSIFLHSGSWIRVGLLPHCDKLEPDRTQVVQ